MSDEGFEVFATLVIGVVNKHVISQMTNFRAKFIPDDPKVVDALSRFKEYAVALKHLVDSLLFISVSVARPCRLLCRSVTVLKA
jgi:hypothetical protein